MEAIHHQKGGVVHRPVLRAFLRLEDGTLGRYDFVVDSGADISLGPRQLARDLGLDWGKGERTELVGISKKKACRLTGRIFDVEIAIPAYVPHIEKCDFLNYDGHRNLAYAFAGDPCLCPTVIS